MRRGCIDQVLVLRRVAEKARERGRKAYMAFLNLEKMRMTALIETDCGRCCKCIGGEGKLLNSIIVLRVFMRIVRRV